MRNAQRCGVWLLFVVTLGGPTAGLAAEPVRPKLLLPTGHASWVLSVAYSPDGKTLATASDDNTARVWDRATGKLLLTLQGHTIIVTSVAYSPGGKTLATASYDNTARVWDVASGKLLLTLTGHTSGVRSVAYSPDGKTLATASRDRTARVWDRATGKLLLTLQGHTSSVQSVAYSPDGKTLATASWDYTARVWDAVSGKPQLTLTGHTSWVSSVAYSPDGKTLATASDDKTARVWDRATGKLLLTLTGHTSCVRSVAYSPDGKTLATASWDRTARVWDRATGKLLLTLQGHTWFVTSVAYSPGGKTLATASGDHTARVWDVASGKLLLTLQGHTDSVRSVAYSPDGKTLATASDDKTARVWDAASGKLLLTLTGHTSYVASVAYSPDGKTLATASRDRTARVWDVASGKLLLTLQGHARWVNSVAYSPGGKTLATASYDNTARVWDVASGKLLLTLQGHAGYVLSVAYSPDGKTLATASGDHTARVWDAASGKLLLTLTGHTSYVASAAYSPDGKTLATASFDHTARVWDAVSGKPLLTLQGHTFIVTSVAYSPDGKTLATASTDHTARVWDARTGRELACLITFDDGHWLVCTPDGYFDGSDGGRQRVSYRVPGTAEVVPVDRFFQDFHRPGLLPLALAGKLRKPAVNLARSLPPGLRIVSPAGSRRTEDGVLELTVEARDNGGGVQGPDLFCNGANVSAFGVGEAKKEGKKVIRRFRVELAAGRNYFEARAASGNGAWESEPAAVTVTHAAPLVKPTLHLVLIGVSDYPDPPDRLRGPANDVRQVEKLFRGRHKALYKDIKVYRLLDREATAAAIRTTLKKAADAAEARDTLVVFAAGHGTMLGQRYYFLSHDFDSRRHDSREEAVRKGGVPADDIAGRIAASRCLKRVLVLDTCAAGGAVEELLKTAGLRRDPPYAFRKEVERLSRSQGLWVIAGAAATEEAREPADLRHGLLTYALLAALKGVSHGPLAGRPLKLQAGRRTVTVGEWGNYAGIQVPELAERLSRGTQTVRLRASGEDFPLLPLDDPR